MLGLLKRHEVEVLLKAGHKRTEVARLTGISPSSVQRIAGEATIAHFNDTAGRRKQRIGRPSIVEGFRKIISRSCNFCNQGCRTDMTSYMEFNNIERKVAETDFDPKEYEVLVKAARKSALSIKEALRQAALY